MVVEGEARRFRSRSSRAAQSHGVPAALSEGRSLRSLRATGHMDAYGRSLIAHSSGFPSAPPHSGCPSGQASHWGAPHSMCLASNTTWRFSLKHSARAATAPPRSPPLTRASIRPAPPSSY